jgi:ATP-dependent RNA helicase RhlE
LDSFKNFNLPANIEKALTSMSFDTPTPIQSQAIPAALLGKDLVGCAQTGTGKTAAFCIPILTRMLNHSSKTNALILVPTRELAIQIDTFWRKITQFTPGLNSAVIMGGVAMQAQIRALSRQPRLIIATPGRLVDHLSRRTVQLSKVEVLVLDEADRMLDMGFAPQLSQILKQLPGQRQNLFFTATWAPELDQLAKKYQITQSVVMTTTKQKNDALLDELNKRSGSVLVFARTKSRTDRVARYLSEYGVDVSRLHGGRTQGQRNAAMDAFRTGKSRVLIATDIAARGIDVLKIGHVINYDLPQSPEDYIHRIGRTGRAGEVGQAVSLITPEDRQDWRQILRLLEKSGSQVPTGSQIPASEKEDHQKDESQTNSGRRSKLNPRFNDRRREARSWGDRKNQRKPHESASGFGRNKHKKKMGSGFNGAKHERSAIVRLPVESNQF